MYSEPDTVVDLLGRHTVELVIGSLPAGYIFHEKEVIREGANLDQLLPMKRRHE